MAAVVGVRLREIGKIYSFDPGELNFRRGDHVIADTAKGPEYGTVVLGNHPDPAGESGVTERRRILRRATEEDEQKVRDHRSREREALLICRQKASERKLDMKIISAEYTFDDSKLLFFFTADGRIDFRDLVKDLAAVFHMRIELRQVGVRDETKLIGGMGPCGRPLCCHSWLPDFVPVSIKMAKEQNLSLNPQKISGVCGRLMCCLKNEADTYAYLNSQLPRKGDLVELSDGRQGEIMEVNVLKQTVRVFVILDNDEREMRDVPAAETVFLSHRKKGQPSQMKRDAMARRESSQQGTREGRQSAPGTRQERFSRGEKPARQEKTERPERSARTERTERAERTERTERTEQTVRPEKTSHRRRRKPVRSGQTKGTEGQGGSGTD